MYNKNSFADRSPFAFSHAVPLTETHPQKTVNVLGVQFPILDYAGILNLFSDWVKSGTAHQVCIANVHTLVTALRDKQLNTINNNTLITMDGLPLVWYANSIHAAGITSRLSGPDLMLACLDQGRRHGWKHFFLGAQPTVLRNLTATMQTRFPGLTIAGQYSPPFHDLSAVEDEDLVAMINAAQPDFLWVALGAPKQEKWIAAHLQRIQAPVQIGVGAAFDFISGHIPRAPHWMQRYGLEWLHRLRHDRRLLKRYLSTNPIFIWLFFKDYIRVRLLKNS